MSNAMEPTPRLVAQAIAELGREPVTRSWRYGAAWRVLGGGDLDFEERRNRLGFVPLTVLRHALEYAEQDTEALRTVRKWNSRGLAVLHSPTTGNGKTHAAARWMIEGFEAGARCVWLAAADWPHDHKAEANRARQQMFLDTGARAGRLVLDDIGAGTTGGSVGDDGTPSRPWTAEPMEGMLMGRIDAGRPTLMLTNSNRANAKVWLGPRLWSRIEMGGGVFEIASKKDLRERDDADLDEQGRSMAWHHHAEIVGVIGCERVDGALVVGDALQRDVALAAVDAALLVGEEAKRAAWAPCLRARLLLGLDPKAIQARARALDERERSVCGELSATFGVEIEPGELTVAKALEAAHALMRKKAADDESQLRAANAAEIEQRKGRGIAAAGETPRRSTIHIPAHVASSAVDDARELALRHHMHVRPSEAGGYEVRRWPGEGKPITVSVVEADGFPSEGQAWLGAAEILRREIEGEAEAVPA